jgi:hypothetical protein
MESHLHDIRHVPMPTDSGEDLSISFAVAGIVLYQRCIDLPSHILESAVRRRLPSHLTDNVLFVRDDCAGADVATLAAARASIWLRCRQMMKPTR